MNIIDHLVASKLINADGEQVPSSAPVAPKPVEKPYSFELNKKQPHLTREDRLPTNIADYPEVPEQYKPLVHSFVEGLQLLRQKEEELKKQEEDLRSLLAQQVDEKNQLKVKLNELAQQVGQVVHDIDPTIDEVLTTFNQFMVGAFKQSVQKTQQTMNPGAQLELLKGLMTQVNKELAEEVTSKFDQAIKQFEITTINIEKSVRVWPIPQSKMNGKAMRLAQEIQDDNSQSLDNVYHLLVEGLTGLHKIVGHLHDAINKANGSNVINMPCMNQAVPVAAIKLMNAKR